MHQSKPMQKKFSWYWPIWVVLGMAFVLRVWGVWYGLPEVFVGDEPAMVVGALKMLQLKTLLPVLHPDAFRLLYYPPLVPYALVVILAPVLGLQYLALLWVSSRMLSVLLGTATVYAVYRLGQALFTRRVGLWAALLLATSFLHVELSHFIRHWVPATLAVTVVAYFAVQIAHGGKRRDYIWAGVAAGLGFGVSYIPAVAMLLVIIAHWFNPEAPKPKFKQPWLWLSVVMAVIFAAVFIGVHPQEFFRMLVGEDSTAGQAKSVFGLFASWGFHLKNFAQLEPLAFGLTVIGLPLVWQKSRQRFALIFTLPVVYLTLLYLVFHDEVRYLLLVLPMLCVVAGVALDRLWRHAVSFAPASGIALVALLFAFPLAVDGKYLQLMTVTDTRQLAQAWVEHNVPAGSRVVTDIVTFRLTPTIGSIRQQGELDPSSLRLEDRTLLEVPAVRYPQPAYEVLPLHFITAPKLPVDLGPEALRRAGFTTMVVEEGSTVRTETQTIAAGARVVQQFRAELPDPNGNFMLPVWMLFTLDRLGPTVTIYQMR